MTQTELKRFEELLLGLQARLQGNVSHLTKEALKSSPEGENGNVPQSSGDAADMGSDQYEQELTLALRENEEQALEEITDALERITQGSYGICEECEKSIPKARLKALPYTRHCVSCARKIQGSL